MNSLSSEKTIAVLGDALHFTIPVQFFRTIRELAKQHHYKFLYYAGEPYKSPFKNSAQANILYELISPHNIDGLIITSSLLSSFASPGEFLARCLAYRPLPMVSLGIPLTGIPSVILDNFTGMYEAVCHLIDVHHLTRIAFLSGPWEHNDVIERFSAFTQALEAHDLDVEQSLLISGDFRFESGEAAVRELLDIRGKKPGEDIQAIVCCNDYMASGVILELQRRGIRIPGEIAILGFDNIFFGESLTPPLSTVHQPFNIIAAQAMGLMLKQLNGETVPEIVKVNSEFFPRCSCGCLPADKNDEEALAEEQEESSFFDSPWQYMEKINPHILFAGETKLLHWNRTLSMLRDQFPDNEFSLRDTPPGDIGVKSLKIMGKTAFDSFSSIGYKNAVNNLWNHMASTLELPVLISILAKMLPQLGIKKGYICLYENPENFPGALPPRSRLILAFEPSGRVELPAGGLCFSTKELLPDKIVEKQGRQSGVILALSFNQLQLGYTILDHELLYETFYWEFSKHMSGTLNGALLLINHKEHSGKLARANATIQEFNAKLKSENLHFKAEMEVAKNIQTALLPRGIRDIHQDFEITASMLPAEQVGGDYYDVVLDTDGALWLGIGDVSGHGLIPGLIMMLAQTVHTCLTANDNISPAEALIMSNRVMIKSIQHRMQKNQYMTCTLLKYQGDGVFQYSGMHQDMLIYRQATGTCEWIETEGVWLNLVEDIEQVTRNLEFKMETGDILALYSDGIIESTNSDNQFLDMNGFADLIVKNQTENIDKMREAILTDVLAWNNNRYIDDMTLLLARRIC